MESPAFWPQLLLRFVAWCSLLWVGGSALWSLWIDSTRPRRESRAGLVLAASAALVLARLGQLYAQTWAFFAPDEPVSVETMRTIATATTWGRGWMLQTAAALLVLAAALAVRMAPRLVPLMALGAAFAIATSPLTGHALERGSLGSAWLAQVAHVAGAVVWIGGLALLVLHLHTSRVEPAETAARVRSFSKAALSAAGLLAATGLWTAWLYTNTWWELWTTEWGRTLLGKLLLLAIVAAAGAYNWRRLGPLLDTPTGVRRLRTTATVELAAALLLLLVTAALVALPMPAG